MRLLTHLANNTEQFKRKFESPSEDDQRLGKSHISHTSGSYLASKNFDEVVRQSSKSSRSNTTWFGNKLGQ
jgi:hypothetical protein